MRLILLALALSLAGCATGSSPRPPGWTGPWPPATGGPPGFGGAPGIGR